MGFDLLTGMAPGFCGLCGLLEGVGEAVGVGAGFDDGAFEGEPVDDSAADVWVGEGFRPAGEGFVGGDGHGCFSHSERVFNALSHSRGGVASRSLPDRRPRAGLGGSAIWFRPPLPCGSRPTKGPV